MKLRVQANRPMGSPRVPGSQHEHGFTLVELMVALLVSMLIVIAVAAYFASATRTRDTQDAAGRLQDQSRYVTDIIMRNIQQAGYQNYSPDFPGFERRREALGSEGGEPDLRGWENSAAGTDADHGSHDRATGRVNGSDSLVIRFQGTSSVVTMGSGTATTTALQADGSVIDCLGQPRGASDTLGVAYSVFDVVAGSAGEPELRCKYRQDDGTYVSATVAAGIETLQFLFGVDTTGDSSPDQWMTAKEVDTGSLWKSVAAVRVGMVLRSADVVQVAPAAITLKPLGDLYTKSTSTDPGATFTAPADGRLRRAVSFTVNLRNRLAGG